MGKHAENCHISPELNIFLSKKKIIEQLSTAKEFRVGKDLEHFYQKSSKSIYITYYVCYSLPALCLEASL